MAVRCGLCSITLSRIVVRIGEVAVSFPSDSGSTSTTLREGSGIHGIHATSRRTSALGPYLMTSTLRGGTQMQKYKTCTQH